MKVVSRFTLLRRPGRTRTLRANTRNSRFDYNVLFFYLFIIVQPQSLSKRTRAHSQYYNVYVCVRVCTRVLRR